MTPVQLAVVGLAAAAAGFVNALAGGGTLISFPVLTAVGLPAVSANVTSAVALCPGYLGATLAQRRDLEGQRSRIRTLLPVAAVGGLCGAVLLLHSGEAAFRAIVPYLILLASALLGAQAWIRNQLTRRQRGPASDDVSVLRAAVPIAAASVYGGYFGAGLSVLVLAILGVMVDDSLIRLNAVKQVVAFTVNLTAVAFFVFSGHVAWTAALAMSVAALAGGALGGRVAASVRPGTLRLAVSVVGVTVALVYLVRQQ
jgi:uncharacterized membrane protein YfcA